MICVMAAGSVAITKTPISTTVVLSVLSDTAMVPVIAIASFVSFLLTTQVSLIKLSDRALFSLLAVAEVPFSR
jgi:hypothetical protein